MTTPTPDPHCSKEKTCLDFRNESVVAFHDGTPCMRNHDGCKLCGEDTRLILAPKPTCGNCKECFRLEGRDTNSTDRYCNLFDRYCSSQDEQCSRGPAYEINRSERLPPCPQCGGATFSSEIDGEYQILCLDDARGWKQRIGVKEFVDLSGCLETIADLERSLEWYGKRMNNLQCWQSSMRDPERKIVCDILANGFTLTTKEEIDSVNLISTRSANEITIEDFCFIDIFDYTNHGRVSDDVGRCKGESCNYCGKFNKSPEDKQLEDEDYAAKVQKE